MQSRLAILSAIVLAFTACDRLDGIFDKAPGDAPAPAEITRPDTIAFTVDGEGVFYATRGANGTLHNTQKIEEIPLAKRATTLVYVEGETPNLRGEEVRYVANLVAAQAGDRRTAVLRQPEFVKASELAGLDGTRAALQIQRQSTLLVGSEEELAAAEAPSRETRPTRRRSNDSGDEPEDRPQGIKIESVGGESSTNSLGFGAEKITRWRPVTVYYTEWCGVCERAMRWMDKHDVDYRAVDVDASDANQREMVQFCRKKGRSPNSVPTIKIGDDIMKGWSASRFQQMAER